MMNIENVAKQILECNSIFRLPQKGARNVGIFATAQNVTHKFSTYYPQVAVKFYKGDGSSKGFLEQYMPYHKTNFGKVPALYENPLVQHSIDVGIFRDGESSYPYVVFQYISGEMLRDVIEKKNLSKSQGSQILTDMFERVWIPLWSAGLRFRDGHTGNWIYGNDAHCYFNDTEQCRKDVVEYLETPSVWNQRDRHEADCVKKIHGIFADIVNATGEKICDSTTKKILYETTLLNDLHLLGRAETNNAQLEKNAISSFEIALRKFGL